MDKTWMTLDSKNSMLRFGQEYQRGVKSFIDFAKANVGDAIQIYCPCRVCLNSHRYDFDTVKFHILHKGMQASYTTWIYHGETTPPVNEVVEPGHGEIDSDYEDRDEYPLTSQLELYQQQHWSKKKNKWITPHAEATYGLSQSEVSSSPVAQQQLIEEVLGKRVARRQGYCLRGPISVSTSTNLAIEMSSLRQQLVELQRAHEELRRQHEEAQKAQEELRRQQEVLLKQLQGQASQIQMLLLRAGLGSLGSTCN